MKRRIHSLIAAALFTAGGTIGCVAQRPTSDSAHPDEHDTPIGTILQRYAVQRSREECKVNNINEERCQKFLEIDQQRLNVVNARIEALLVDSKTNLCDLVRFAGACNNPLYTLGDLADCLQVSADRGEALNSGRFVLRLDAHGCATEVNPP